MCISPHDETAQVAGENEFVYDTTNKSEGRLKLETINHHGLSFAILETVIMLHVTPDAPLSITS